GTRRNTTPAERCGFSGYGESLRRGFRAPHLRSRGLDHQGHRPARPRQRSRRADCGGPGLRELGAGGDGHLPPPAARAWRRAGPDLLLQPGHQERSRHRTRGRRAPGRCRGALDRGLRDRQRRRRLRSAGAAAACAGQVCDRGDDLGPRCRGRQQHAPVGRGPVPRRCGSGAARTGANGAGAGRATRTAADPGRIPGGDPLAGRRGPRTAHRRSGQWGPPGHAAAQAVARNHEQKFPVPEPWGAGRGKLRSAHDPPRRAEGHPGDGSRL
ncbi:MAG: hypothetical protein AVDCRST_MAG83-2719, partial [uncultured Arthrobacter sp.]